MADLEGIVGGVRFGFFLSGRFGISTVYFGPRFCMYELTLTFDARGDFRVITFYRFTKFL